MGMLCCLTISLNAQQTATENIPLKRSDEKAHNLDTVNSYYDDYAPQISPDGRYLIFQSNRPGYLENDNLWISFNLNYKKSLETPEWTKPVALHFPLQTLLVDDSIDSPLLIPQPNETSPFTINTDNFEGGPALLFREGLPRELFFNSLRNKELGRDGFHGLNIYYTYRNNGQWSAAQHLNLLNSDFNDRMPAISQDGRLLIFSSDRPGSYGGYDLWISKRDKIEGKWSQPVNAGPLVNTVANESAPSLGSDGKLLFFSSDRLGGEGYYDLYVSSHNNNNGQWQSAQNLGRPFNSKRDDEYFSTTQDGHWAYFTSDRKEAKAKSGFDIYRIQLPQRLYFPVPVIFTGQVIDATLYNNESIVQGIEATIHIFYERETMLTNSQPLNNSQASKTANNFGIRLNSGHIFRVRFSAPGYLPQEIQLDYSKNLKAGLIDRHIIALKRINAAIDTTPDTKQITISKPSSCITDEIVCLAQIVIYFKVNHAKVPLSEMAKVKRVVKILKKHPNVKIRIEGHADNTNSQNYNQTLSEKRAEMVHKLLEQNKIKRNRISSKGYSFLKPAVPEKTTTDRALNRRVEFRIIND